MLSLDVLPFAWVLSTAIAASSSEEKSPAPEESAPAVRDLSPLLETIIDRHRVPGMAAAVVELEGTVAAGAAGVRRAGSPEKVTAGDRFHIGSCTKAMTATLCALLVEEGKLSWERTLAQAFPELEGRMRPEYREVTLAQLLSHRGGMPADLPALGALWKKLRDHRGSPTAARRLLLEGVIAREPEAPPGTRSIYSNAGYAIAGHMAEKAARLPWEELLRRRIFEPLRMSTAGFGAPGSRGKLDEPRGHTAAGRPVEPGPEADNPPALGSAGTVHCSIGDWARFIALHLRGARGEGKLLRPESFHRIHEPVSPDEGSPDEDAYAMGWLVAERPWAGGRVLTHAGSNTLWYAVVWIAPERGFAVLVATNRGDEAAEKACDDAVAALMADRLERR